MTFLEIALKFQMQKFILRQAQDDGLKMLKNRIMVSLSNHWF